VVAIGFHQTRRTIMRAPLPFILAVCLLSHSHAAKPPNVVLIVADDLGVMDVSPYNPKTFYDTPALQSLADSGVRFTAGYAACPVCSPTRSAIMTGQWPARTRNTDYFGGPNEFFGEALPAKNVAYPFALSASARVVWEAANCPR
jgi:arylsulfatase A-like enzyme